MNIKKSIRILFRNKTFSLLNIAGLAIGITAATLIFLWVESKVNFNKAIPNSKNIYIAGVYSTKALNEYTRLQTSSPFAETLKEEFPEVKRIARYTTREFIFIPENETHSFEEKGAYADTTLFELINMKLISGSVSTIFEPANSIVISQSMAQKIYGLDNPIGKGLINDGKVYEVTGVFKDLYRNTSFEFDWLMPFRIIEETTRKNMSVDSWGTTWFETYVELNPYTDMKQLSEKLKVLPFQKADSYYEYTHYFLYPFNRVFLYGEFKEGIETGGGYIRVVRLVFFIGVLILFIACINFMNLSTARSQKRALEVGMRKTFGTKRKHLIRQFLVESGLITLIALVLSIGLIFLTLPLFNKLIDGRLFLDFTNPYIVFGLLAIGLFCTFTAGSYPALYLSSFNPITTLKMQKISKGGFAAWLRKGLVVFQFTMAFILICTTYVTFLQIRLAQNRDIGIDKNNLVIFPVTPELLNSYSAVLNELNNNFLIESCGFSSNILLYGAINASPWQWNGKNPEDDISIAVYFITEGLMDAAGIKLIDGTDVNPIKKDSEGRGGVLINETLAEKMGDEGRIGGKLGQLEKSEIVGIIKNFISDDPYAIEPKPMIFFHSPTRASYLFVRLNPDVDTFEAIGHIQSVLRTFTPYHAFDPIFMTDRFDDMFEEDRFIEKLSALFAILAIFISCLGLFGLSAFSAEQRTKEIGIRKVLGANIPDILVLLGKSYMVLLLISFIMGVPISLYMAQYYLKDYAFRIIISWDIFIGVALLITLIALLTVSFQSLRAAIANPVKSIKTE